MKFFNFTKILFITISFFAGMGALQASEFEHSGASLRTTSFEVLAGYDILEEGILYSETDVSLREPLQQSLLLENSGKKLPNVVLQLVPGLFLSSSNRFQCNSEILRDILRHSKSSGLNLSGFGSAFRFSDRFNQLLYLYQKIPS